MKQAQIRFVFWDCENTLVETAEHHWRKHVETLKQHDIILGDKHRQKIYNNSASQNHDWIKKELGLKISAKDYLNQTDQWYLDHIHEIKIRKGVKEGIEYFEKNKVPQAVVSRGHRHLVRAALEAKNLTKHFRFILCKESCKQQKPQPEPYLMALKRMENLYHQKINPINCLVIEDDPIGVQAGDAAGMLTLHRPIGDESAINMLVR